MFAAQVLTRRVDSSESRRGARIPSPGLVAWSVALSSFACGNAAAEDPPTVAKPAVAGAVEQPVGVQRLEEAPPPELPETPEANDAQPVRPRRPLRSPVSASNFTQTQTVINDDGTMRRVTTMFGKPIDGQSLESRRDPPGSPPRAKLSFRTPGDEAAHVSAAAPVDDNPGWLVAGAIGACVVLGLVVFVLRK